MNAIISEELPNKIEDPLGFHLVEKHMMHGPCGKDRPSSPCMKRRYVQKNIHVNIAMIMELTKMGISLTRDAMIVNIMS